MHCLFQVLGHPVLIFYSCFLSGAAARPPLSQVWPLSILPCLPREQPSCVPYRWRQPWLYEREAWAQPSWDLPFSWLASAAILVKDSCSIPAPSSLKQNGGGSACSEGRRCSPRGLLWWGRGAAAAMGEAEKFYYVYSCDLDINVQLKMWVRADGACSHPLLPRGWQWTCGKRPGRRRAAGGWACSSQLRWVPKPGRTVSRHRHPEQRGTERCCGDRRREGCQRGHGCKLLSGRLTLVFALGPAVL